MQYNDPVSLGWLVPLQKLLFISILSFLLKCEVSNEKCGVL